MTLLRSNFGDLLAPGFRDIFNSSLAFGEYPPQMEKLFNILSSKRQYEDDSYISSFGLLPEKTEGAGVTYDNAVQGFDKRYTHKTYAMAYRITEEMQEDELYGLMVQMPSALARSTRISVETDATLVYNRGFNPSYVGADNVELFSLLHLMTDGSTQKNELTNAADLNADSLKQALIDISETTDDRGLPIYLQPRAIVVAVEGEWDAQVLLGSTLDPDSANNAINPAARQGLELIVNNYLTDSDAWFILCDVHRVNWFWRVRPNHMQGNDFDTGDAKFKVRARWSRGWSHWAGVFGSPGV